MDAWAEGIDAFAEGIDACAEGIDAFAEGIDAWAGRGRSLSRKGPMPEPEGIDA